MSLRLRLALAVVLASGPAILVLLWLRGEVERRSAELALRDFVVGRMEDEWRSVCERDPEDFSQETIAPRVKVRVFGHGPAGPPPELHVQHAFGEPFPLKDGPGPIAFGGPPFGLVELYAYAPGFRSKNVRARPFPPELESGLDGRDVASRMVRVEGRPAIEAGLRMPWTSGPCTVVLARRFVPGAGQFRDQLVLSGLALGAAILCAVLLAAGPIVRRLRRLASAVTTSAGARYETPVPVEGGDEIAEVARAFNAAGAEVRSQIVALERREHALRAFVANTTHDVAVPLTVLQTHLAGLRDQDPSRPVERAVVTDALEEVHYIASLLHNLGAAAKLEAPEPELQRDPVDLNALVERAVGRHRPIARPRTIELDFAVPERPVSVLGDVTLIEQAVGNAIHNAVRYNRPGGHVAVLLEEVGEGFSLRVIDDGPGLTDAEMASLTAPETAREAQARPRAQGGSGLGLRIARDVARRHGFTLELRRSEHGGLEVAFTGATAPGAIDQGA
ncbi:MAG TPA: HAMP domain-containing sensor histidine kinase [Planctomycetota bacterium]|nr:HAMP domain-containing sensor histidine kinase [Planctomycetota bacterium]